MSSFTASDLLDLWEITSDAAGTASPAARALAILSAAHRDAGEDALAALPVGERDQQLLRVRRAWFGRSMPCHSPCPRCGEALELDLDVDALLRPAAEPAPPAEVQCRVGELLLTARPPNSRDLLALTEAQPDGGEGAPAGEEATEAAWAERRLAELCVLRAVRDGEEVGVSTLTAPEVEALADALGAADPRAELLMALECAECDHRWSQPFDIGSYLAIEIEIAAHRLLRQVHALAHGFGWREADVLALSPLRRRAYLELLGA